MVGISFPLNFNTIHVDGTRNQVADSLSCYYEYDIIEDEYIKSFLTVSQDLKVNLFGLQQDKHSDGNGKNNDVGIAWRFPRCNYTVGPHGKGPTGDYTTCTYSN